MAQIAPALLIETIDQIAAGTAVYKPQDESQVTFAHKLKKSDGFLDWTASAESVRNMIRGLWPWPGAQAVFISAKTGKSCRVTIAKAHVVAATVSDRDKVGILDENLNVICGQNVLKILQLKPAGARLMDFKAFVNGRDVRPGDTFVRVDESS